MTEQHGLQLSDLLGDRAQIESKISAEVRKDARVSAMALAWDVIGSAGAARLRDALNVDVLSVAGQVWCKLSELHEYGDASKYPMGKASVVPLGRHTFTKLFYPTLKISIGEFHVADLRFTLIFNASIRAADLTVLNGYVTGVGAGDGDVSAQLKLGDYGAISKQSQPVQFPKLFEFAPPGYKIP